MEIVLTPEEMRKADKYAIDAIGIPSAILMENAARSASDIIYHIFEDSDIDIKIIIICGSGNNGGDGFALARHLHEYFDTVVYWYGDESKMSHETKTNFQICNNIEMEVRKINDLNELNVLDFDCDCIIDAMIGVGGSETINGLANEILDKIKVLDMFKIALDVPTGLNSLNGKAAANCFKADYTITMYARKLGLLINDGPDFSGEIFTAELGAPSHVPEKFAKNYIYDLFDLDLLYADRERKTSKFDYGKVVIIAGSKDYPGAAALCANAAITAGAGLVELFTEVIHPALLPEIIIHTDDIADTDNYFINNFDKIVQSCEKADAVLIGPGLSSDNVDFAKKLIHVIDPDKKLVIDADAISSIDISRTYNKNIIITPHVGELGRLIKQDRKIIDNDAYNQCISWANKLNLTLLLKHYPSVISDGELTFLTVNGNSGMATAGSGDVLSGFIVSLCAQGFDSLTAASFGSYIHALCGDYYVSKYDETTLTASKLIESLSIINKNEINEK